jgi:hypothetical protein
MDLEVNKKTTEYQYQPSFYYSMTTIISLSVFFNSFLDHTLLSDHNQFVLFIIDLLHPVMFSCDEF